MSDQYMLVLGSKESGPYTLDQLRDLHLQGMLHQESQLKDADGHACQAADVEGLFPQKQRADEEKLEEAPPETEQSTGDKAVEDFSVYSSEVKQDHDNIWSEYMTPRHIFAAVFLLGWMAWGLYISGVMSEKNEEAQKNLNKIEAQQQYYQNMQDIQERTRPNISPEQIQDAMQRSNPNNGY